MVALFDQLARVRIEFATAFLGLLIAFPALLETMGVSLNLNGAHGAHVWAGAVVISVSVLATKLEACTAMLAAAKDRETDQRYPNGGQR